MQALSPSPAALIPQDMLLLFADISGYTRFIRDNPYDLAHATWIIHQLIEAVTQALAPRFRLVKLEGDAAFCAAEARATEDGDLGARVLAVFEAFQARKAALAAENACPCDACMAISGLDLKVLLHRGDVVAYASAAGPDLSGLPVIVLHRLSKNGVRGARYVLWTEPVAAAVGPLPGAVAQRVERYPDIGAVPVSVFDAVPGPRAVIPAGPVARARDHLRKTLLWLPLRLRGVPRRRG